MRKRGKVLLQVSTPIWFRVLWCVLGAIACVMFLPLFFASVIHFAQLGFTLPRAVISLLLVVTPVGYLAALKYIYCRITATESGLEAVGILQRRKIFSWGEIVGIRKPRFAIPNDAVYIFSETGRKIVLSKSMTGFLELLNLIQSRAPNLFPKELPDDILRADSPRQWRLPLIVFLLFIIYVIARLIF